MIVRIVLLLVVLIIGGGMTFLATSDLPPPSHLVEKPIPADRFTAK